MSMSGLDIRRVEVEGWDSAVSLVGSCGLPVADLAPGRQDLWGAFADGHLVGVIGTEGYEGVALVRSMAVAEGYRKRGVASALYQVLEASNRTQGRRRLVLLTETAQGFFALRGFATVPRDDLPGEVKASAEFQGLCPVSAVAMVKPLTGA